MVLVFSMTVKPQQARINGQIIIDQLVRNMELGQFEMGYSVLAPCIFSVYLHPDDYKRLACIDRHSPAPTSSSERSACRDFGDDRLIDRIEICLALVQPGVHGRDSIIGSDWIEQIDIGLG